MKRREFIVLAGAAAWPIAIRAQQPAMPVIGFLRSNSFDDAAHLVAAFRLGLKETGFIEGQNVAVEFRSAENQLNRLPAILADFIRKPVAVIVANTIAAGAAKAATTTIPIVFTTGSDPVRDGLVASLGRPGGNITGAVFITSTLGAKRLELLRQLVPKATTTAMLVNPNTEETERERKDVQAAAHAIGQQLLMIDVGGDRDIETAFAMVGQRGAGAVLVGAGPFFFSQRERVVAMAARHAIPTMYSQRDAVVIGGLLSYGSSNAEAHRQAGIYAGRILKGEQPANLPVAQSTKFEFTINLKTAKTLGLEIPPALLAVVDEVIE